MHSAMTMQTAATQPGRGRGSLSHLGRGAGDGDGGHGVNGDNASLACGQDDVLAATHTKVLTQLGNELQQHRLDQSSRVAEMLALAT